MSRHGYGAAREEGVEELAVFFLRRYGGFWTGDNYYQWRGDCHTNGWCDVFSESKVALLSLRGCESSDTGWHHKRRGETAMEGW